MNNNLTTHRCSFSLVDEQATVAMGKQIAKIVKSELNQGIVVYLNGDLGAGKTTITRGFVQGMGHVGHVKSPTYTLVEPYDLVNWQVYHFDLYRLADPEELEFMGIRDYFNENCCCFIEWPEKGNGLLANADITINMAYQGEQRLVEFQSHNTLGKNLLLALERSNIDSIE
ncbi:MULTISPECIES: tRNA (adenosine(37)-N6)-threonylcarbamoyltransferase complex ATPase subunit type 1 TsaE [Thalassotalea]|uniref:tRNA threonylcarbamoyladenosine biosynthesis protein TsaE n=1 Tax=Thalassotalea castellviae TaxID=3075612 RepID=A0ABU3A0Q5_9GAMM|nr:tRNA (adenosine(37)-N6)-threonylcarbamoyltransferase complex ATPase subunit type 1 TsaE [Thalassotalea sp. W431]MDT0603762.1 tRNA (adenosine(37)-N6)-threonylcarbamoyltransferase complex ATPase subunit type 1 TsaE [Thalassotalea sp. W431]